MAVSHFGNVGDDASGEITVFSDGSISENAPDGADNLAVITRNN